MVMSKAASVADYLEELPAERRAVVSAVRKVIRKHLPEGYREAMGWGMICYEVPLARYPDTYNAQPLCYAGLAAQKHSYSLYLTSVYHDPGAAKRLRDAFAASGRRLDMGKGCIRFKRADDLPLAVIGELVAAVPVDEFITLYERSRKK